MSETTFEVVMAWLNRAPDPAHRAGLARYSIPEAPALGVPMADIKCAAKQFRPAHDIIFLYGKQ